MPAATKKKTATKKTATQRPSDVDLVKASAANPGESRAGTTHVLATAELDSVSVVVIDGARAEVEVKKQLLDQAGIHTLIKILSQASQETY